MPLALDVLGASFSNGQQCVRRAQGQQRPSMGQVKTLPLRSIDVLKNGRVPGRFALWLGRVFLPNRLSSSLSLSNWKLDQPLKNHGRGQCHV